jgi:hypothetical protein
MKSHILLDRKNMISKHLFRLQQQSKQKGNVVYCTTALGGRLTTSHSQTEWKLRWEYLRCSKPYLTHRWGGSSFPQGWDRCPLIVTGADPDELIDERTPAMFEKIARGLLMFHRAPSFSRFQIDLDDNRYIVGLWHQGLPGSCRDSFRESWSYWWFTTFEIQFFLAQIVASRSN